MKRLLTLGCGIAAVLTAQEARTVLENDQIRVLKVLEPPHLKTRLHRHEFNRVMIYLDAGRQSIAFQDGKIVEQDWKAGEVKWSPAGGMHTSEIVSAQPVTIVEVEIKKPGGATAPTSALDPVKVDPKHYKVEFENDQVRVLRVKIPAKGDVPMHEHGLNRVVVYLTDQSTRVTNADGKVETVEHKAMDVSWGGPATHQELNLSAKPFEAVVVELKG